MQPGRLQAGRHAPARATASRPTRPHRRQAPRTTVLLVALLAALLAALPALPGHATKGYAQAEVTVHGEVIRVDVADTPEKQSLGLGGRARLGPNEGMLFVYPDRTRPSFWMRGMVISIDMIWLDNRRVVHIEHNVPPPKPGTEPGDLPTYQPDVPANFVLELAAGRAKELGLRVGDEVHYRFDLR